MDKEMLDFYTDFLLRSFGQASATNLSRLSDGTISHDRVTRFLNAEEQTSAALWREVKALVRQVEDEGGVLIVDDSIADKSYTDENELIAWHYDHSRGRNVKGINFLTALYQVPTAALPVAFDLVTKTIPYIDKKTGKAKRKSAVTKNERFRMLLHVCHHNQLQFQYVLADAWYSSADNMRYVKLTLGKDFIFPLKENRKVSLSEAGQRTRQFHAVSTLDVPEGTTLEVWLDEVPFALRLSRQVFRNDDGSEGVRYLVTSDLTLEWRQITETYHRRWSIEPYHQSLKQNASLEKSPTRRERTQRNHLFASLCAYIKLERLRLRTQLNHFALKSKIYLSALKAAHAEFVKLKEQLAPA
ncbi:MAG: transposase [Acidobacteria bacterium]|nr:transposase [Acidobacteriota bacterium]